MGGGSKRSLKDIFRRKSTYFLLLLLGGLGGSTLFDFNIFDFSGNITTPISLAFGGHTEINHYGSSAEDSVDVSSASASSGELGSPIGLLGEGTCLQGGNPVPCDTPHNQEVISVAGASCNFAALYAYVAGNLSIDYFAPSVDVFQTDGGCIARFPDRQSSIKNAWKESGSELDSLRACFAGEQANPQFVDCSQPHVGEVVYAQDLSATGNMDCDIKAEEYTNTPLYKWKNELEAKVYDDPGAGLRRCVLSSRNGGEIETGLRNLRSGKVEIKSS